MPNIKPISDLRNYTEVLRNVAVGETVFLTKNGRGKFAVIDINEYESLKASLKLMSQLSKGEQAGREKGWLTIDALEMELGINKLTKLHISPAARDDLSQKNCLIPKLQWN